MAYSIFILPEGLLTVTGTTGGNGLDGVTQGDGSHLVGATITLGSNAWQEIELNDNDPAFADNDTGQRLANSETVQVTSTTTQTFGAGTIVEAEYGITVSDPDGNTYQLVAVNFRTGSPSYATIEGLAFLGPQGGFPPIGVPLTVVGAQEGPSYTATSYATPICFASGTAIATPEGEVAVETLHEGQMVLTADGPPCPIRWIGRSRFPALGRFAPVEFAPGTVGNARRLRLSRQHRLLVRGWQAEMLFGAPAVWVPAGHFVDQHRVRIIAGGEVVYHHLLLDGHHAVLAEGVEAESLHPGDIAAGWLSPETEADLLARFPEFRPFAARETSYPVVTAVEARALLAA
ncbi:hypothetical protein roselon_02098 [Roseibacterium elongatum DSM 19469]|uniref:Hedgehog/Intein (Hint) domain-containing protein n=1 Tax=Roseicyclus elongatus DSM 19469 TaxID=1294273 RepID=W8RTF8_9RHOB|nr:Hint domain-containing protein [Roseibacterium elongatum]AHM04448.1 hypothetical protein roselon_02098 [Roseibacterium elongatum DSM 19469]